MQSRFLVPFILIFNFLALALICFWADSEVWPVKVAGLEGGERIMYDYSVKPLFLWILSPFLKLFEASGVYYMDLTRVFFGFNGLLIVYLGGKCTESLTGSKTSSRMFFLLILTSALFLQRGYRVRADLLVSSTLLLMIFLHLQPRLHSLIKVFVLAVGGLICLGLTMKSAFVLLCFLPFFVYQICPGANSRAVLRSLGFAAQILVIGVVFVFLTDLVPLNKQFQYLLNQYSFRQTGLSAFSPLRFQYIIRFIWQNPLIVCALGLKIFWVFSYKERWAKSVKNQVFDFCVFLMLVMVCLYPNRLPFFLASLLPILLIGALNYSWESSIWNFQAYFSKKFSRQQRLALVIMFASFLLTAIHIARSNHNFDQRIFIGQFRQYLELRPGLKVYDPSGLLPRRGIFHNYLGPGQREDHIEIAKHLVQQAPDLILAGQRWAWIHRLFFKDTEHAYVKMPNSIFLKANKVEREPASRDFPSSQLGLHVKPRAGQTYLTPRRVILRAGREKLPGDFGQVFAMNGDNKVYPYPTEGASLLKFRKLYRFNIEAGYDHLLVVPVEYSAAVDKLDLQRLMSFDHWL